MPALDIGENLSIRLREWLLAGGIDLALLFDPPHSRQRVTDTLRPVSGATGWNDP